MKPGVIVADHYRVVRLRGRGGMSEVFEVVDTRSGESRALKLLHAHVAADPALRTRFELEARLGGGADEHLVEVFDAGVDNDTERLFLVMELLAGESLAERLKRLGPRPADEVVDQLAQLAGALDRLHDRGIVHRDLKPANLFLEATGRIKLLDLGVAKVLGADDTSTSVTGTPVYMAPEQLRGRGIEPATDRYALALVAYTLLVGGAYWDSEGALDPITFGLRAVQGPPERATVRAARAGVTLPAALDAWFARATAVEPARRFRSATVQIRALARALGIPITDPGDDDDVPSTEDAAIALPATIDATVQRPRRRVRWLVAALVASGAAGMVVAVAARGDREPALPAVLACPMLAVDDPRDNWLGAAAASIACERVRFVLGGAADRALVPADLLSLPRQPVDAFPAEPYDALTARDATITAARARGAALLDGRVRRTADGFDVELALRGRGDRIVATGHGRGRALFAAVRAAMPSIIARLPSAPLGADVAEYVLASGSTEALGYLDLMMAFANNAGDLREECARIDDGSVPAALASWLHYDCAYTLGMGTEALDVEPPAPSTHGAEAARVRIEHMRYQRDDTAATERLVRAYREEPSGLGRSTLAASISRALQISRAGEALEWAQRAVQADPRNFIDERCAPWVQLATLAHDTERARSITAGWRAWAPWDSYAWSLGADHATDDDVALSYARRAYALSPYDTYVAGRLADRLLRRGLRDETRAIAVSLGASDLPVHALLRELLEVRLDASMARFAAALAHAEAGLRVSAADHGWVRQQRLELAWRAVQIGSILGRGAELADRAFAEFLEPDALPIDGGHIDAPLWLAAICTYTSKAIAPRCFARLEEVLPRLAGGFVTSTAPFIAGARMYAAGDLVGAARAWRPLIAEASGHVQILSEAMVHAFAAIGEHEIVERIASASATQDLELHGASLTTVRAALAARARGDRTRAETLANRVLAAWSTADTEIPLLAELRRATDRNTAQPDRNTPAPHAPR
jgi:hypothetical protein